jgi:hypothetical protein
VKRKKILFTIFLFVAVALTSVEFLWVNEASVSYGLNVDLYYQRQGTELFTVDWSNNSRTSGTHLSITISNGGYLDGTFSLVVSFTNATVSEKNQYPNQQVDGDTIKLIYTLRQHEKVTPSIHFNINTNVSAFVVTIGVENGQLFMKSQSLNRQAEFHFLWQPYANSYYPVLVGAK